MIEIPEREQIPPGWHRDLSNDRYHSSGGISSTTLKKYIDMTPAAVAHGQSKPFTQTPNMRLGSIVHKLVWEPLTFTDEYAVIPEGIKKPTAAQINAKKRSLNTLSYLRFEEKNQGVEIIKRAEYEQAIKMRDSVLGNPDIAALLDDMLAEQSIYWWYKSRDPGDDTHYKLMAKVRPDALSYKYPLCFDLKTCRDATVTGFGNDIHKFGYHVSAAMYLEGVNQNAELMKHLGWGIISKFVFICVETEEPYLSRALELDQESLDLGRQIFRRLMLRYKIARDNNFPGYPEGVQTVGVPGYAHYLHII